MSTEEHPLRGLMFYQDLSFSHTLHVVDMIFREMSSEIIPCSSHVNTSNFDGARLPLQLSFILTSGDCRLHPPSSGGDVTSRRGSAGLGGARSECDWGKDLSFLDRARRDHPTAVGLGAERGAQRPALAHPLLVRPPQKTRLCRVHGPESCRSWRGRGHGGCCQKNHKAKQPSSIAPDHLVSSSVFVRGWKSSTFPSC